MYQNMGWYYRRFVVPRILKKCKQIITVSQFECHRIQATLHLPEEQIIAIHNGFSERFHPLDSVYDITKKYIPAQEYLFFLGNTDPKKNTPRTLKAYSVYVQQSAHPLPLLIADLKEEIIHQILKQEGIENIKTCAILRAISPILICPPYTMAPGLSSTRPYGKVLESLFWKPWRVELRLLLPTPRPSRKLRETERY